MEPAQRTAEPSLRRDLVSFLLDFPAFVVIIGLAGFFWRYPLVLAICFLALTSFLLWRWWSPALLVYFLVGFLLGPAGELLAVRFGAWTYAGTDLIPVWLPFAWGTSAIYLKRTGDALTRIAGPWAARKAPRSAGGKA